MPRVRQHLWNCQNCHAKRAKVRMGDKWVCKVCLVEFARSYPVVRDATFKKYDLSPEEHGKLYVQQFGVCAICAQEAALVIDHDHRSGQVRGLLCRDCNLGLGMFKDSVIRLSRAINYVVAPPTSTEKWAKRESTYVDPHLQLEAATRTVEGEDQVAG